MKKLFIKIVGNCRECPNVTFTHFDGEGESWDYQYNFPSCKAKLVDEEFALGGPSLRWAQEHNKPTTKVIKVPKKLPVGGRKIPIPKWCPLQDWPKGKNIVAVKVME